MTALYKLTGEMMDAVRAIESMLDAGDVDAETAAATIEGLQGEIESKAINVAMHIKNLRSDLAQLEEAKASFASRIKSVEKSLSFYESYLDANLRKSGIDNISSPLAVLSLICGESPPDEMVRDYLARESEDLQSWAARRCAWWPQGLGAIDAAIEAASNPVEGDERIDYASPYDAKGGE